MERYVTVFGVEFGLSMFPRVGGDPWMVLVSVIGRD